MADPRLGKIAIPALATTAYTAKQPKKRKTELEKKEYKKQADHKRSKSRVDIGRAFPKWRELRDSLGLKLDSELASLLLDSYDKMRLTSTPRKGNYNRHAQPVQKKGGGSIEYRKLFKKKSRKQSPYTIKVEKDYSYNPELQRDILQSTTTGRGMPRVRTQRPDDPQQYGGLCGISPPTTEELLRTQVSRGADQEQPTMLEKH